MLEIDGSRESGSGTVVRDAVSLSVLTGKDLRITNIRAKREKPGLRPQHLKAIEAAAQICCGKVEGAAVGSKKIEFRPQEIIKGGEKILENRKTHHEHDDAEKEPVNCFIEIYLLFRGKIYYSRQKANHPQERKKEGEHVKDFMNVIRQQPL